MILPPQFKNDITILLTATIIPNGTATAAADPQIRLREYIKVVKFYQQFAPVIFLENSGYPLNRHAEFSETAHLHVKQFPPSTNPTRGKGYQEFEMLDAWLDADSSPPPRWLKISGRYQICNIENILGECRHDRHSNLIIDQLKYLEFARTYLFYVTTDFYRERIRGLYRQCNDQAGNWIERVLFQEMKKNSGKTVRLFKTQPQLAATDGSSGRAFPSGSGQRFAKQILRSLNRLVDQKYQWYPR